MWPGPPPLAPGDADRGPAPTLEDLRRLVRAGDAPRVERAARRIVDETRPSTDRTLAAFVLGMHYRERGLHNLASESFTIVRTASGPIAEWGGYYEAEQDLLRGKPWVAIRECEALEKRFPAGRFSAACTRLTARAYVATGNTSRAREVAAAYDASPELDPISEQIDLAIARRWAALHPDLAVPLLRKLAVQHQMPLTGRVAEELLAELAQRGVDGAALPDDTPSIQARAISLRDAKRKAEAWEVFSELERRAADNPPLAAWVEGEKSRFLWRTHRWDALAERYAAAHAAKPSPEAAWDHYRALDRAGRFREALAVAVLAQAAHPKASQWRGSHEQVARTAMLARDYTSAKAQFDHLIGRGGWTARRAELYGGIAALLSGDARDAEGRFGATIERNRAYQPHARYWRAKALDALERRDEAERDRDWLVANHAQDWYGFLVRHMRGQSEGPPWDHRGRWPAAPPPEIPEFPVHSAIAAAVPIGPVATPRPAAGVGMFGTLTWPLRAVVIPELPAPSPVVSAALHNPAIPPDSYRTSPFFDEADAMRKLQAAAKQHGESWTDWQLIHDFSKVGLHDLSGPLLSSVHEEWKLAIKSPRHPRHAIARKISSRHEDWRPLFYAARDHHHTDRYTFGLWDTVADRALKAEALRLGWPLAHDQYVWSHARTEGVDPYLVLAIMRVESRYDAVAVSRVGARGAMQIMPRTGALLADIKHDEAFLAGDLEDPILSVGYGIYYFGRLLERFDGAYPLAVAAYNGGPFNVSSWLRGVGDLPIDELVEHIPYRETRRYVRRVVAAYQTYLDLYGRPGDQVRLPAPPYADDPSIVDF